LEKPPASGQSARNAAEPEATRPLRGQKGLKVYKRKWRRGKRRELYEVYQVTYCREKRA